MIFLSFMIPLGSWRSVFAVPSEVVDKHLRLAGAAQLKVLLFLLRHSDCPIEVDMLAENIGIRVEDAKDAVEYWVHCGLLCDCGTSLSPAGTQAPAQFVRPEPAAPIAAQSEQQPVQKPAKKERVRYSYSECAQILAEDDSIAQMLPVIEGILDKQLNHTEIATYVTIVRWYGLQPDCLAMLVSYCKSIGKPSSNYIEATARGWSEDDITTIDKAEEKIARLTKVRTAWNSVRNALDIPERKPTAKEEEYCMRWLNEWCLGIDVIKLAYEKCVDAKGKLSFAYMNGIIKSWYERGALTVAQIKALPAETKDKPKSDSSSGNRSSDSGRYSPTYNISEIEEMLDDDWLDSSGS